MSASQAPCSVSLVDYFQDLEDPRMDRTKRHPLIDIVFIAICAVVSDANSWASVETFARSKRAWLARYLALPDGLHAVPSGDAFRRVFSRLDPEAFEAAFRSRGATTYWRRGVTISGSTTTCAPFLRRSGSAPR